jgi:hypothetical protein
LTPVDPLAVARLIGALLEESGLRYVIGGSVAASVMGEPRASFDLDLMIDADAPKVRAFVRRLSESCYVDEQDALDAVRRRTSFNAVHLDTSMKIDFFIVEAEEFARDQLVRRRRVAIADGSSLYFYTAEDLIVRKLLWFRSGGETSELQWRDVLGILRTSRKQIDRSQLRNAAVKARVEDLLDRALRDADE